MAQSYGYAYVGGSAQNASVDQRARFIVRTYNHLFGAIILFTAIEFALFQLGLAEPIARAMSGLGMLVMLGAFMLVSWLASRAAFSAQSKAAQYGALAAFVVVEALFVLPMLVMANNVAPGAIQSAGVVTILGFAGLSAVVFKTRKDFSFLGGIVRWGIIVAVVAIVASAIFGFQLGTFFSVAMIGIAGAAILHDTSNVLHHFPTDRHVGAALQLFASVALLFFYVLRLILSLTSRD